MYWGQCLWGFGRQMCVGAMSFAVTYSAYIASVPFCPPSPRKLIRMPKVSRKDASLPLQETVQMDIEHGELPDKPSFAPLGEEGAMQKVQFRRIPVPQHRLTPLKASWMQLYEPITKNLKLDMRMNLKTKKVNMAMSIPQLHSTAVHYSVGSPW